MLLAKDRWFGQPHVATTTGDFIMLTYCRCEACNGLSFLTLIEPHPTVDDVHYRSYECSECSAIHVIISNIAPLLRHHCSLPPKTYWIRAERKRFLVPDNAMPRPTTPRSPAPGRRDTQLNLQLE